MQTISVLSSFILTSVACFLVLLTVLSLRSIHVVSNRISRKVMHILTGPIFVLCWLMYPSSHISSMVAAMVPFCLTIGFVLVGYGLVPFPLLVQTVSRSGDRAELLLGPLLYGLVHCFACFWFWRHSPIGIIAICSICVGDGFAEVIGQQYHSQLGSIPWNRSKSVAGSLAFVFLSVPAILGLCHLFMRTGYLVSVNSDLLPIQVFIVVIVNALVESLDIREVDNLTIFLSTVFVGSLIWN